MAVAHRLVGAVLCGGASRRMGRDKALVEVDGVALARRVADALVAGGCETVLAIGGDADALAALGLEPVPDRWPGEGPLGGLATALAACTAGDVLVLAPCDWVHPSAALVVRLVTELLDDMGDPAFASEVAYPWVDGRGQWLPAAWRVGSEGADAVAGLFAAGHRRLDAVLDATISKVVDATAEEVADADTPDDLPSAARAEGGVLWYASHPEVAIDADVPVPEWGLSAVGRARAHDLAARVVEGLPALGRIVTSAEAKAVETARIVGERTGVAVEVRPATHENDRSSTGFLPPPAFERHADAFFARPDESVDGWERAVDAQARIVAALADLIGPGAADDGATGHSGRDVLVVGHGAVGTLWACHLAGVPIDRSEDQPGSGHLYAVDRRTARLLHRWRPF